MKALLLVLILAVGFATPASAQSAEDLFQQALRVERISGNTEAAIELYGQIVTDHATERAVVARALLQMGKAYEILGRDGARDAYSRVVNEYGDYTSVANEAAERIAAFRKLETPAVVEERLPGSREAITLYAPPADTQAMLDVGMSPDGRYITRFADAGMVLQDIETGTVDSLTVLHELCGYPYSARFSPNGNQIAFGCFRGPRRDEGPWGVAVYDRDSREAKLVFDVDDYFGECDGWLGVLDWSADGSAVLAGLQGCWGGHILLLPVAGGNPTVLERDFDKTGFWTLRACLLQNGHFMFGEYGWEPTSIHRLDTSSGERVAVLTDELADTWLYDCFPESNTLIYSRSESSGPQALFATTVKPDGTLGAPRFLARLPERSIPIPGVRNGNVHYGEGRPARFVAVADVDTRRGRAVSNVLKIDSPVNTGPPLPRWSPDGSQFIVTSRWTATIAGYDGIERTQWKTPYFAEGEGNPEVRKFLGRVIWSPDGSQLISSQPDSSRWSYLGTEVYERDSGVVSYQVPDLAAVAWLPDATGFYYVAKDDGRRCLSTFIFESRATSEVFCLNPDLIPAPVIPENHRWPERLSPGWSLSPNGSTFALWGNEHNSTPAGELGPPRSIEERKERPFFLLETATWEMKPVAGVTNGYTPQISWSGDSRLLFNFDPSERVTHVYDLDRGVWEDWPLSGLADMHLRSIAFHPSEAKVAMTGWSHELKGLNVWILHQPPELLGTK